MYDVLRKQLGWLVIAISGALIACGETGEIYIFEDGTADYSPIGEFETEPEYEEVGELEQGLVVCDERPETGYEAGKPYPITVVTADGKPAEKATANAYSLMQDAAAKVGVQLRVVSGFRSQAQQQYLYNCYKTCSCNGCNLAAKPGYSNHQSGEALDLNTRDPGVYNWLSGNAWKFGFKRTVSSEPWHWEYQGGGPGGGTCSGMVKGAIAAKYNALGGAASFLGKPVTHELTTPDTIGRFNHFEGGSIYWTPSTGAWSIRGDIRNKWKAMGWETSALGYPVSDETKTPDGIGRFNHFQGGSIYWTAATGARPVLGAIRQRWAALGWEKGYLGYPIADEAVTAGGIGRYTRFQRGTIYWYPDSGAYPVYQGLYKTGFYLRGSLSAGTADNSFGYGTPGDVPLMCDWDGDGVRTPGVFRKGTWHVSNSNVSGKADVTFGYGQAGDTPVCGDWDGDGIDTPGVVRSGTWYLRNSNSTGTADLKFAYGVPEDVPVVGDWDGDGVDTPGVFRLGKWFLRNSNSSGTADLSFSYGDANDVPVAGDWDGDGVDTPAVFRRGKWFLRNTNSIGTADLSFSYGLAGDHPLVWENGPGGSLPAVAR
jgi:hypothetical protein